MNANQLLAIGAALVTAVRRNIKYSENLYLLTGNSFFDERYKKYTRLEKGLMLLVVKLMSKLPQHTQKEH
ncbi:hypothetical protein [Piscirickettsia salmonis]|uniref:hypothetical protein n=1 Tax=Piscirickettsia salmonis TaxID=1238 RepID=UPI00094A5B66|nr:hypothetical protein [Piscirickettsia salmonis]APS58999.1 hypothetical protein AVI52_17290 [Piscirickettsia salmonis]